MQRIESAESPVCKAHCFEGSSGYAKAMDAEMLPLVRMNLQSFAPQLHTLLHKHGGAMPLLRSVNGGFLNGNQAALAAFWTATTRSSPRP